MNSSDYMTVDDREANVHEDAGISVVDLGKRARKSSYVLAGLSTEAKNRALLEMADEIDRTANHILAQNARDLEDARKRNLSEALLDRLRLDDQRIQSLTDDVRSVVLLEDPVGEEFDGRLLSNGMRLVRRRIPLGVVGVIYEARPNVTVDTASLCLKTGNAAILRGGSETLRTNLALVDAIRRALVKSSLPEDAVLHIESPDRSLVAEMLRLDKYIDMIIPRGGPGLHRLCREESTIPVITGGIGICHIYVDEDADLERAVDIVENAKVQRPSVCNALDTLLVHRRVAEGFLPVVARRLAAQGVSFRADPDALEVLRRAEDLPVQPADPEDFDTEWLSLVLGIRVVNDLDDAIEHIRVHSTEHSDGILTRNLERATTFVDRVNSAAVYVNASTRFTDGGQFGLGAEVAVSTQKLHARGPMGLRELTTYKWIGYGDGHIRA